MKFDPCCVYLLRNEWSEANYKIGISNNPDRRCIEVRETYKNVLPKVLTTAWFPRKRSAFKAEQQWHRAEKMYLSDDHGGKEWFSLPQETVEMFTTWASQSLDLRALRHWLFAEGAKSDEIRDYTESLLRDIPRNYTRPMSINTWFSPDYYLLDYV